MLSSYREVAATALTVKVATSAAEFIVTLKSLDVDTLLDSSWDTMQEHKALVMKLSNVNETIKQLKACAGGVEGSEAALKSLIDAKDDLFKWLDSSLCEEFDNKLETLQKWANDVTSSAADALEKGHFQQMAAVCPSEMPTPPDFVNNAFVLHCSLVSQRF